MAKGFKHGAGGPSVLNFKVVGGTSVPPNPKENTIWVNTDTAITSYIFSATQPIEPAEGMVWFVTSTSGGVEFNAIKKNGINLRIMHCKQYVGGTWKPMSADIYIDSAWVQFAKAILYLYKNGDRNLEVTGNFWHGSTIVSDGVAADGTKFLDFPSAPLDATYTQHIGNPIDLTPYSLLVQKSVNSREYPGDTIYIYSESGEAVVEFSIPANNNDDIFTYTIDISHLKGLHSITFQDYGNGYDNWDVYELYLE